jgi:hypothetical protein
MARIRVEAERGPRRKEPTENGGAPGGVKHTRANRDLAQAKFLERRAEGHTVAEAMRLVGYSESTYEKWRQRYPEFKEQADRVSGRLSRARSEGRPEVPDFPEFCEKYLGWRLHWHQLQWFDVLENREPRDLHPSQIWEPAEWTHIIVNTPPEHAKTSTVTMAWVTWKILKDPEQLITIVSKNREMAADFLSGIKEFLTNPTFSDLQDDFGPEEGYEKACTEWSQYRIRFGPKLRKQMAKDPTVQAVGIKGQIYGKRGTVFILDDCVDTENYLEVDKQFNWITRMVATRVGAMGKVLVIGSRVAQIDLYKELRNPDRYAPGVKPAWTYFAQPAVLEYAEDAKDWVTLWPRSNQAQLGDDADPAEDGTYEMWSGPRLAKRRDVVGEHAWIQGYQQGDLEDAAIFPRELLMAVVNKDRKPGPLTTSMAEQARGRPTQDDLYVVGGIDPASSGHTAFVVYGVHRAEAFRYLLDVENRAHMTPVQFRATIIPWTKLYSVKEWRVESVLLSNWIMQDREIVTDLANMGCILAPHQTSGKNKWDPIVGVMGMSGLIAKDNAQIELPNPKHKEQVRQFVEQAATFFPETKGKTDILMAWWFAEIRARELIVSYKGDEDTGFIRDYFDTELDERLQHTELIGIPNGYDPGIYDSWWD